MRHSRGRALVQVTGAALGLAIPRCVLSTRPSLIQNLRWTLRNRKDCQKIRAENRKQGETFPGRIGLKSAVLMLCSMDSSNECKSPAI